MAGSFQAARQAYVVYISLYHKQHSYDLEETILEVLTAKKGKWGDVSLHYI